MADSPSLRELHVEGGDDQHAIVHLMKHHGVDFEKVDAPRVKASGSVEGLLKSVPVAVKGSSERVGFVLDADASLAKRWSKIRAKLAGIGADLPDLPPAHGFIGEVVPLRTRVGVWLMPDNVRDGKLEDFLGELIDENDPLIGHARSATEEAETIKRTFRELDRLKAVLHCWLAWQKAPGRPYGTAMKARYFQPNHPVAEKFAAWFRQLFDL